MTSSHLAIGEKSYFLLKEFMKGKLRIQTRPRREKQEKKRSPEPEPPNHANFGHHQEGKANSTSRHGEHA
jgi:hypothetical protein